MKRPSFFEGAVVAMVAASVASVAHTALTPLVGSEWLIRLIVAGLGLAYVLYLLHRGRERIGRITTVLSWFALAGLSWFFVPGLLLYLVEHLGMVWLARSLYHQPGVLSAAADLGLNALALMSGVWALVHSGSFFLGVWTFFLVQALFVFIPSRGDNVKLIDMTSTQDADHFQQAYRNAEAALRRLSSLH